MLPCHYYFALWGIPLNSSGAGQMHCPWNKGYITLTVQNATKVNFYCQGGKPFNLQNKLSESEIKLDILTHFFPSHFFSFIIHSWKLWLRGLIIEIFHSVWCYHWAFSFFLCHVISSFTFSAFVVYKLLKSLWSIFLLFEEKMISQEIVYLTQLRKSKVWWN